MKKLLLALALVLGLYGVSFAADRLTCGTIAASTGADVTADYPANRKINDIFILTVLVKDVDDTITTAGFVDIGSGSVDRGSSARYWWRWMRWDGTGTNVLVDKSTATGDTYARVCVIRGAPTTGNPFEVVGTPETGTADPAVLTGVTTLSADALVMSIVTGEDDNNTAITCTATDPASLVNVYAEDATGTGMVFTICWELRSTPGASGNISVNWDVANPVGWGALVVSIKGAGIGSIAGNRGLLCEANSLVSSTSLACTTTVTAPAGRLVILGAAKNNASTTSGNTNECSSVTDSVGGNTWGKIYEYTYSEGAANSGATVCAFYSILTNAIASGQTITLNISDARTAKAMGVRMFTTDGTIVIRTDKVQTEDLNGVDTGSLTISGLSAPFQRLFLRLAGFERGGATLTRTTNWESFALEAADDGADESSMEFAAEFFNSPDASETSDPAIAFSASHDGASFLIAIESFNPSGPLRRRVQ